MDVINIAKTIGEDMVKWRRAIHRRPEIGLETPETSQMVARLLTEFGIEVREKVGGWGVVGLLKGAGKGKTIALRADMDALPIQEETGAPYGSQIPGRMHACGHDGHTAMLLGAAKILAGMKDKISGNVKFIFQPGEEGYAGAKHMIADGCLKDPDVDAIIGGHLGSIWKLKSGCVGLRPGPMMAASDGCLIKVKGKGGHGAAPHLTVDPVVIAAHVVLGIQDLVSREISPFTPAVVTVGAIEAGTAANIIPESCSMRLTIRYFDPSMGDFISQRLTQIATGICEAMRGEAQVNYRRGYPPLINHKDVAEFFKKNCEDVIGPDNVSYVEEPTMGAEDMSFYLREVPGVFFALGSATPEKGTAYPHHHPKFDIDEDAMQVGAAVFVNACLEYLK